MRKIYKSILMACLIILSGMATAQTRSDYEVSGLTGSTTLTVPSRTNYRYSLTEMIYTYSQLPGVTSDYFRINSISFYCNGNDNPFTRSWTIYMKNVSQSSFSASSDYIPVTADDIVFSGTVNSTGTGWMTITLNKPFYYKEYSGNHLLIAVDDNSGNYDAGLRYFRGSDNKTGASLQFFSDSQNPDPTNISSFTASKEVLNQLPSLKFNYNEMSVATMPYNCDFENATERDNWMLKNTSDNMNAEWHIVGSDHKLMCGGQTNEYQKNGQPVTVLAERLIKLSNANNIDIEFKLTVGGEKNSDGTSIFDYVMVFLAPYTVNWEPKSGDAADYVGSSSTYNLDYALHFGGNTLVGTKLAMKTDEVMKTTITNPGKNQNYKLIFAWRNDNSSGDGNGPIIDNIKITDQVLYNLTVAGTRVTSSNCNNITSSSITQGTVSYNPTTQTLTLNNAKVTGDIVFNDSETGYTNIANPILELVGNNEVFSTSRKITFRNHTACQSATVKGTGYLKTNSVISGTSNKNLTIQDCELYVSTEQSEAWSVRSAGNLNINNAKLFVHGAKGLRFNNLSLTNSRVVSPAEYTIASDAEGHYIANNGAIATEVLIDRDNHGIAQNEARSLNVYPNPANDRLYVEGVEGEVVRVYDNTGRVVIEQIYTDHLNVSNLSQGVYAVATSNRVVKFVKK